MVLISFEHLEKILIFPKFQLRSSKIVPATPFWILKFKWAWQTQFLSHNLVTLKNYVFFKDLQMILVPFFHIPTGFQLRKNGFKSSVHILRCPWIIESRCLQVHFSGEPLKYFSVENGLSKDILQKSTTINLSNLIFFLQR